MNKYLKNILLLLSVLTTVNPIFGQRKINFNLEVANCIVYGDTLKIRPITGIIVNKKYSRFVVWENDSSKLAILIYAKIPGNRVIEAKVRVDAFEDKKWRKPKLRLHRHGRHIYLDREPSWTKKVFSNTTSDPFQHQFGISTRGPSYKNFKIKFTLYGLLSLSKQ
jgi:hypothetical protein